jgi:hypothetical protein
MRMCRNIQRLYNIKPPASETEIFDASLQYVRKVSGFRAPSKLNEAAYQHAVEEIAAITGQLIDALRTSAPPREREARPASQR